MTNPTAAAALEAATLASAAAVEHDEAADAIAAGIEKGDASALRRAAARARAEAHRAAAQAHRAPDADAGPADWSWSREATEHALHATASQTTSESEDAHAAAAADAADAGDHAGAADEHECAATAADAIADGRE